jgi:IclR helix-turn-helix domain
MFRVCYRVPLSLTLPISVGAAGLGAYTPGPVPLIGGGFKVFPKQVFWIGAKGGLVEEKHRRRMGEAIWLFLWLILRQTGVNDEGEGIVHYGKPITIREIAADTRLPRSTLHRWADLLIQQDYLRTEIQSSGGTIFWILNAKEKRKGEKRRPIHGTRISNPVPLTGQACPTDGTRIPPNAMKNKELNENATKESSKDLSYSNKDAASNPDAGVSISKLAKAKAMPRTFKSQKELDAERRRQLDAMRAKGYLQ